VAYCGFSRENALSALFSADNNVSDYPAAYNYVALGMSRPRIPLTQGSSARAESGFPTKTRRVSSNHRFVDPAGSSKERCRWFKFEMGAGGLHFCDASVTRSYKYEGKRLDSNLCSEKSSHKTTSAAPNTSGVLLTALS
jgi:hypothetical protein